MRYYLLIILIAAIAVLSGCGADKAREDILADDPQQEVELVWFNVGMMPPPDLPKVMEKANEYLKPKLNCKLKMIYVDAGNYTGKVSATIQGGDHCDLFYSSSKFLDFRQDVYNQFMLPLNELLGQYGGDLRKAVDPRLIGLTNLHGRNYLLPVYRDIAWQQQYVYRTDVLERNGLDAINADTLAKWRPLLEKAHCAQAGNKPFADSGAAILTDRYDYIFGCWAPGAVRLDDKDCRVVNQFDDPDFVEELVELQQLVTAGLATAPVTQVTALQKLSGRGEPEATMCMDYHSAIESNYNTNYQNVRRQTAGKPVITTNSLADGGVCIAVTSAHPARAMKFLNLLYTDKYLANLLVFGIEGTHYQKTGDNTIHLLAAHDEYDVDSFLFGNVFLQYVPDSQPATKLENIRAYNAAAVQSPLAGFFPDAAKLSGKYPEIVNVSLTGYESQYRKLRYGDVDIRKTLAELKKQSSTDMGKYLQELQQQVDEWRKTK